MSANTGGSSSGGGGHVTAQHIESVLKEVDSIDLKHAFAPQQGGTAAAAATGAAAASTSQNFCSNYGKQIRPLLLGVTGLLKLFHRGDAANAIAQAVAFLDLTCGTGEGGGTGTGNS